MSILRRESRIPRRRWSPARRGLALWLLAALAPGPAALADEAIYLNSGEEYRGTLRAIADGKVLCEIAGKERVFELANLQRIEFQRRRQFDDVAKAGELPALPVFQAIAPTTEALAKRFPQAGRVVLYDSTRVRLQAGGRYEVERLEAWRILHERAADSAKRALAYFPDRQRVAVLYGLTVAPDGTVSRVADSAMKDEALYAAQPAYDVQHRFRLNLRGPVPGATLILATRISGTASPLEPLVVDRVFHGPEPALRREVRLVRDEGAQGEVSVAALNGLADATDGVWAVEGAPQLFPEPLMPPVGAFAPRLVLAWPQATWAGIARAFRRRAGGAARVRRDGTPAELFALVRTQVRIERVPLDALPDGPAKPAQVLARGYGTEVERALLLAALLRGAGQQAETVLVRARGAGPLVEAVPRLRGLNRAVVRTAGPGGKAVWLQADDEDRGWAELDPDVQGAQGLGLAAGAVVAVPVLATAAESLERTVEVELAPDGSAKVTDLYRLHGRYAHAYRDLRGLTDAQLRKWVTGFVGRERTGVHLLEFDHSDFAKANAVERLRLVYRVPALADRAGRFLLLRLPNAEAPAPEVGRSTRQRDLFWSGGEREAVEFVVRAPAGYRVYALGEALAAKGDGWSAAAAFDSDAAAPGLVRFRDTWERSAIAEPQAAYAAYRAARIRRSRLRGEIIVFAKH